MIIFDLACLSNDEHRRHFIDPKKNHKYKRRWYVTLEEAVNNEIIPEEYIGVETTRKQCLDGLYKKFQPDYQAYYDACGKDEPFRPCTQTFRELYLSHSNRNVEIWGSTCESVRREQLLWFDYHVNPRFNFFDILKLRPIDDTRPQEVLFEEWFEAVVRENQTPEFVFSSHKPTIEMFRRRGVFVFDCNQGD